MSVQERKVKIPAPPTPAGSGNLLSSVAPPSQLPNFITAPRVEATSQPVAAVMPVAMPPINPQHMPQMPQMVLAPQPVQPVIVMPKVDPDEAKNFSPAIPLSKGEPTLSIRSPEDSQATQSPESLPESTTPEVDKLGDIMPGSGLFTWVKGAVSTSGFLQEIVDKAKSSVDSIITTLDPQMKEYLKSGGDLLVVVASDKEVKISPVREAFQAIFGKAIVIGFPAQSDVTAAQSVGYAAAYAAAKQRIAVIRSAHTELTNNDPVIAVESFMQESITDRWYDISLLVLSQPSLGIELQIQSQGTPVPSAAAAAAKASTPSDYQHAPTGYSVTCGSIMAANLQVPHTEWQEAVTGVSRRELLVLAARSLAGSYKRLLAVSAAET